MDHFSFVFLLLLHLIIREATKGHALFFMNYKLNISIYYGSKQDFLDRGLMLAMKLLNQGFLLVKLKSSSVRVAT